MGKGKNLVPAENQSPVNQSAVISLPDIFLLHFPYCWG